MVCVCDNESPAGATQLSLESLVAAVGIMCPEFYPDLLCLMPVPVAVLLYAACVAHASNYFWDVTLYSVLD